ncbi:MAG: ATP-binding protein [Hyphomicrobiales bacterium]|nr:MAG: ATP-binding protein [Hyphomicrobiales bacterium]
MSIQKLISIPRKLLRTLSESAVRRAPLIAYLTLNEQRAAQAFVSADVNKPIVDELLGPGPIGDTLDQLDPVSDYRIMFLPTYRRIERDLNQLFPNAEEIIHRYQRLRPRSAAVEFIQFGMDDVKTLFDTTREVIRARSHRAMNQTSSSYLQDVLRGEAREYDPTLIRSLDDPSFDRIMQSASLTSRDAKRLREVTQIVRSSGQLMGDDNLVAHYLIKLIEAMRAIAEYEKPIQEFVHTVNGYLFGKTIRYDPDDLKVSITNEDDKPVELRELSSGEKQIVSLFAHVFLEDTSNLVFIDEPELSLSADWQTRFLPDLTKSRKCEFLLAVTHSPFIFDNELEPYAIDMRALLSYRHDVQG